MPNISVPITSQTSGNTPSSSTQTPTNNPSGVSPHGVDKAAIVGGVLGGVGGLMLLLLIGAMCMRWRPASPAEGLPEDGLGTISQFTLPHHEMHRDKSPKHSAAENHTIQPSTKRQLMVQNPQTSNQSPSASAALSSSMDHRNNVGDASATTTHYHAPLFEVRGLHAEVANLREVLRLFRDIRVESPPAYASEI